MSESNNGWRTARGTRERMQQQQHIRDVNHSRASSVPLSPSSPPSTPLYINTPPPKPGSVGAPVSPLDLAFIRVYARRNGVDAQRKDVVWFRFAIRCANAVPVPPQSNDGASAPTTASAQGAKHQWVIEKRYSECLHLRQRISVLGLGVGGVEAFPSKLSLFSSMFGSGGGGGGSGGENDTDAQIAQRQHGLDKYFSSLLVSLQRLSSSAIFSDGFDANRNNGGWEAEQPKASSYFSSYFTGGSSSAASPASSMQSQRVAFSLLMNFLRVSSTPLSNLKVPCDLEKNSVIDLSRSLILQVSADEEEVGEEGGGNAGGDQPTLLVSPREVSAVLSSTCSSSSGVISGTESEALPSSRIRIQKEITHLKGGCSLQYIAADASSSPLHPPQHNNPSAPPIQVIVQNTGSIFNAIIEVPFQPQVDWSAAAVSNGSSDSSHSPVSLFNSDYFSIRPSSLSPSQIVITGRWSSTKELLFLATQNLNKRRGDRTVATVVDDSTIYFDSVRRSTASSARNHRIEDGADNSHSNHLFECILHLPLWVVAGEAEEISGDASNRDSDNNEGGDFATKPLHVFLPRILPPGCVVDYIGGGRFIQLSWKKSDNF